MTDKPLRKHLVDAAKEYLKIDEQEIRRRITLCEKNINEEWEKKTGLIKFYADTEWQIYGLLAFNDDRRVDALTYPLRHYPKSKILDYGGGIGEVTMTLARNHDMYYHDIPGKTQDFAKFLSEHSKRPITFLTETGIHEHKFDVIIIADVLEHVTNPLELMARIVSRLNPGGSILTTGLDFSVGKHIPMHLAVNRGYKEAMHKMLSTEFYMKFFEGTINEVIYLWKRRG